MNDKPHWTKTPPTEPGAYHVVFQAEGHTIDTYIWVFEKGGRLVTLKPGFKHDPDADDLLVDDTTGLEFFDWWWSERLPDPVIEKEAAR